MSDCRCHIYVKCQVLKWFNTKQFEIYSHDSPGIVATVKITWNSKDRDNEQKAGAYNLRWYASNGHWPVRWGCVDWKSMAGHRPLTSLTAHHHPSMEPEDLYPVLHIHRICNSRKFEVTPFPSIKSHLKIRCCLARTQFLAKYSNLRPWRKRRDSQLFR